MQTRVAGMTDTGLLREHNEDSFLLMPEYRIVAVADGMGGHRSGDVASQLAIATLSDFFTVVVGRDGTWPFPADPKLTEEENYMVTGLRLANRRIFDRSLKTMADFGMGTTIVSAIFNKNADRITVGHVGDSRCYRLRGDEIKQLTRDHSLVSDARHLAPWMTPAEVSALPSNVITRALGIREDVVVDVQSESTEENDVYLLCSDGLSGLVSDTELRDIISRAETLEDGVKILIERANLLGGIDNITAILAKVVADDPAPDSKAPNSNDWSAHTDPAIESTKES